jgi:flagellar biosynthesis/type III secretory pathway protein FliH
MLAERAREWTQEWKEEGLQEGLVKGRQEGLAEGRQEGLAEGRKEVVRTFQNFLLSAIAERFGPVPESARLRVESIVDPEELNRLGKRLLAAGSLTDLGL